VPLLSLPTSPLGPLPAGALVTCTNTWTGAAGDNQWLTAKNWSTGAVPAATDDVCIGPGRSTSTTVDLGEEGSITVDSLTVGGGTGGTQTLDIGTSPVGGGGNNQLTLNSTTLQSGTLSDGAIDLGSVDNAAGEYAELTAPIGAPAFSNAGHIVAESTGLAAGPDGDNFLDLDVTNTGTLEVAGDLGMGQAYGPHAPGPVTLTNDGTLSVDSGGYFEVEGAGADTATLADDGGTITNSGSFEVTGGIVNQEATAVTGTAIHLVGSALNFTGSGPGLWDFQSTSNTVSGNMVAGQTIRVDGGTDAPFPYEEYAELTVQGSNTWGGTVILDSDGVTANDWADLEGTGTQTIPSGGELETEGTTGGNDRYLRTDINVDGGSLDLAAANNVVDNASGVRNITITAGNMTVEGTAELNVSSQSTIDAEGGTLTDDGSLILTGYATFTENATDASGGTQPILLDNQTGLVFTGTGKGEWDLQGGPTLTGNMVAGQTVRVLGGTDTFPDGNAPDGDVGNTNVHLEGSYSWGGTVILDSLDGQGQASMETAGAEGPAGFTETIASGGQLQSVQGGGDSRVIDFNIINNGTVDLAAADNVDNENNVITNNATMTIEGQLIGDNLNTSGDDEDPVITNNGTLDLGANAVLSVFDLTESANATLGLTVNGNPASGDFSTISAGPTGSVAGAGTISLDGTLDITLLGGYSPATKGDTFPILAGSETTYEPTVTGTFTTVNGAQISPTAAFSVSYAASSFSLVVSGSSGGGTVVLAASNVSAPTAPNTSPSPGQPVSATFQVVNNGTGTAEAPWNDSVYVGTGTTYDPSDLLLERIPTTNRVGPGDTYDVTVQAFLPPLAAGSDYHLFVVPDSAGRVSDPSADTQAASPAFTVAAPPDLGNGPVTTDIAAGQDYYVQVNVGASVDEHITVNEPGVDLLATPGAVFPTENASTDQASGADGPASLILPQTKPGVWYIDLHGEDDACSYCYSVTVQAATIGLTVNTITPTIGSDQVNALPTVIALQGSDFGSDTTVTLSNSGDQQSANGVDVSNSTLLYATFALGQLPAGVYDLIVTSRGQTTTRPSAFTVIANSINQIKLTATGPGGVRFGWTGSMAVTITNVGNVDVTVPIIRVTTPTVPIGDAQGGVAAPGSTSFGLSADIVNPDFTSFKNGPLPPSVLPPGDSATFLFPVQDVMNDVGDQVMSFEAQAVTSADPTPMDWAAELAPFQPSYLSAAAWTAVVDDVANQMGPTEGSYAAALPAVIAEAAGYEVSFASEDQILGYLIDRAMATASGAPVSGTLDGNGAPLAQTNLSLDDGTGDTYGAISWYNGQFNIWDVSPGTYELAVPGYTPNQQVVADPTANGLTVTVATGATLSGVITDAGYPVSGAIVTATDSEGTFTSDVTGGDGSFQISGLESGDVSVTASAPDDQYAYVLKNGLDYRLGMIPSAASAVTVSAPATTTENISLLTGAVASGTISIPGGGSPPAGTAVVAQATDGSSTAIGEVDSNGDGGYTIGGLAPGDYTVTAIAPGFGETTASMTVVGTTAITGQNLALTGAATVSGVVTDADSHLPLAGATVYSDQLGAPPITTGADGSYTLTDLAPGPVLITILPPDDTHVPQQIPTTVSTSAATALNVALVPAGSMTATIDDGAGNPLAGIDVTVVGPPPYESPGVSTANDSIASPLVTDDTGTIAANDMLPGPYDLQVQGSTVDHPFTIGPGTRNVTFTLTVPVATVGGVVDDAGGGPASGVPVAVTVGGFPVASTTTTAGGTYQFSLTQTGPVDVVATSPAVGILVAAVSATIGSPTTVPTLTAGTGSVQVTVNNGSGPVQGASVNLSSSGAAGGETGATTDALGNATLDNLTPGTYELGVADGTDAPATQTVTVGSTGQGITVTLGTSGTIAGKITDADAVAISGASVVAVVSGTDTVERAATTAADGTYQLAGLTPGTYSLSISDDEHVPTVLSGVVIAAGGTADGSASLASTGSTLTLTLSPAVGSTVLPGVLVGVEDSTGTVVNMVELGPARSASDAAATQAIANLAPGSYTLLVEQAGAEPVTQVVTLAGGGSTVVVNAPAAESLLSLLPVDEFAATSSTPALASRDARADTADTNVTAHEEEPPGNGLGELNSTTAVLGTWLALKTVDLTQPLPGDDGALYARVQTYAATELDPACYLPSNYAQLVQWRQQLFTLSEALTRDQLSVVESALAFNQQVLPQAAVSYLKNVQASAASAAMVYAASEAVAGEVAVTGAELITGAVATATTEVADVIQALRAPTGEETTLVEGAVTTSGLAYAAANAKRGVAALGAGETATGAFGEPFALALRAGLKVHEADEEAEASVKLMTGQRDKIVADSDKYHSDLSNLQTLLDQFQEGAYKYYIYSNRCTHPPTPPLPAGPIVLIPNRHDGDPNGITGTAGYSSPGPQWVAGQSALPYVVNFQNEPTATAPVVQVVVTQAVPPGIDPDSVQLTGFGFGASTSVNIPAGNQSYSHQFTDLALTNGDDLDVSGVYDPLAGVNGTITWTFSTIDPTTGDLDSAPNAGFLPPDDAAGDGEGFVSWTGTAKSTLTTGTTVAGQASIVFDRNAPIATPVWTNTIDANTPTASVTALPADSPAGNLTVAWTGSDANGSGVGSYDLYESTDGGPLTLILPATTLTSTQVPIVPGHTYGFAVDATNNVGNQGAVPTAVQTTTSAVTGTTGTVKVSFNSDGGATTPAAQSGPIGTTITLPAAPTFPGHTFTGWWTAATGGTQATTPYALTATLTLFAQWTTNSTATPTVTVTYPVSGSVYGTNWSGAITGSASAKGGKTISSVKVSIENTTTGKWWNTTSFSATSQTFVVATGTTNWSFPLPASDLVSGDAYSVSARATDSGGDVVTSSAVTFSYAVATPIATTASLSILFPVVPYGFESAETFIVMVKGTKGILPSGKVTIKLGSVTLCSTSSFYALSSGTIVAACSLTNVQLPVGRYAVTAVYSGNSHYAGSTSGAAGFQVTTRPKS
jgi:hypothetical protein